MRCLVCRGTSRSFRIKFEIPIYAVAKDESAFLSNNYVPRETTVIRQPKAPPEHPSFSLPRKWTGERPGPTTSLIMGGRAKVSVHYYVCAG